MPEGWPRSVDNHTARAFIERLPTAGDKCRCQIAFHQFCQRLQLGRGDFHAFLIPAALRTECSKNASALVIPNCVSRMSQRGSGNERISRSCFMARLLTGEL